MPKGDYQRDSNYFIGELPDGTVKWYCEEGDWWEEYNAALQEKEP